MHLRSLGPLGLVLLASVAAGCADRTALIVEVTSSDLSIPTDIDSITIEAVSEFGATFVQTYPVSTTWPHSLTITPPPGEASDGVRIDVTGNLGGAFVVRRVVGAEFVPGETRRVQVVLTAACVGLDCPDGYDCTGGRCCLAMTCTEPDAGGVDAPGVDGGDMDGGNDAPVTMDVPVGMDAPPMDAGSDTGMDAGRDTGVDAPLDGGTDAPLPAGARLVINEVDYDQTGTDTAELVEIYNAGTVAAPLGAIAVLLINGSGGAEYARATLSGTLAPGGYVVAGIAGQTLVLPGGVTRFDFTGAMATAIQNGPDGVVLVDTGAMSILDRFSYGSPPVTSAIVFGSTVSLVEGTAFTTGDSGTTRSLCRIPNGTDTDGASLDFMTCSPTVGAVNTP